MPYELMIFKTGNYPQGNWPKERTQRMVDAYDPVRSFEAPLVIGHRYFNETDEDEAAHGWVQSLRMDGNGKVFAAVDELSPDIKRAAMEKKYKYISCEIWENDLEDPSAAPYLRAIALLGRTSPALPTAKLPSLFSFSEGIVCSQDKERKLTYFSRKIKPEEFGLEPGRKHKKEETIDMDELEKLKQENERLRDEIKEKDSQISSFTKREKDHKEQEARKDAESFYTTMKNEGKLFPALFEKAVELDQSLSEDQRKSFRDFLGSFEKVADLSGKHFADKKDAPDENLSASLVEQIKAYQEENKIDSFEAAAKALQVKRPELFV